MRTQRKLSQEKLIILLSFAFQKPVVFLPIQNLQWENFEFYVKVVVQGFSLSRLKSKLRSKTWKRTNISN